MARISTYAKDANITNDDKLLGSNYGGLDNQGRPIFTTANFKIADLLAYFSENIEIGGGGSLGGLLSDVNKIKTLYTYDEDGNYTGLSEAGVLLIANSEVADGFASASFQTKVFADVLSIDPETGAYVASSAFANTVMTAETTTDYASASILNEVQASIGVFDENGVLITLSEAFANSVMTAETTTDYASATILSNVIASIGTDDGEGNITISEAFANSVMNAETTTDYASASFVNNLGASIGTVDEDGNITVSEAFANSVMSTESTTDYASAQSVTDLSATVSNKPDIYRQDDAPDTTVSLGSLWYDTNDGNKLYVLIDVDGTPTWILTEDGRFETFSESISTANQSISTNATNIGNNATFATNLAGSFGTYDAEGNLIALSEAFANQVMTTETTTDYAEAGVVTNLSATVGNIPRIYRQDEQPSITDSPIGSLWFDTDNNNKAYILVEGDPDNVWTLTEDTEFTQFKADYEDSIIASSTNSSANVTKITNLNATLDILDTEGNSKYTNAEYKDTISTYVDENSATAQRTESMAAELGFYNAGTDTYSFSSANLTDTVNALALTNYASTQRVNTIESKVDGKPDVYRQDEQPAIYTGDPSEQVIPEGSIWYDTDADNKVYVVAEDPENDGVFIWTLTDDSRIGAAAEQITNIAAEFGSFDANNNFTIDTSAGYFEAVKAYADDDSAAATKISNLGAEIGTFDENNNFSTSLSANFKQAVNNEVDQNSATAGYVNNLSAAVGIDKLDGTPQSQATALVNGATSATTTSSTLDGVVSGSKQLVLTEVNADIKVGQYVTYSEQSSTLNRDLVWRVEAIDGINIYLDNEIYLEDATTITFTGTDALVVDNVSGTIREGFQIKGSGVTPGTYVSAVDGLDINMSRAEVIDDDVALEFLGIYAAITETANVVAKVDGSLESTYGLQVDANGNVAGMKLLANNEGSEVSFLADSFKVYNGSTAEAPFEVVGGEVKIKSAAIQQVSFGDLSGIPDYFVVTTVYADDALGTNASTTKGTKNFYGIHQGQSAWEDGDSVAGITFNQITGDQGPQGDPGNPGLTSYFHIKYSNDNGATFTGNNGEDAGDYIGTYSDNTEADSENTSDYTWVKVVGQTGIQGPTGDRVYTTNLFYQTIVTGETAPTFDTTDLAYDFDTAEWSGIPTGWDVNPPSSSPGSGTNKLYYVSASAVEGSGVTVGNPTTYFNFNGLVTFTGDGNNVLTDGTSNFDYTAINGAWITTGAIKSSNFTFTDADENETFIETEAVTEGAIFDLVNGYIKTPNFWLHSNGNAYFTGDISGSTGTFKGVVDILDADDDVVVKIHDGDFVGVQSSNTSATFPDVNQITITTWDASDTTVSTTNGVTKSVLFNDNNSILYSDVKWVQFPAGTTTHTLVTDAITDPIATTSSDYYGFFRVNLGVEFGNADFSTIYYSQIFPNVDYEADGEVLLPSYTQNISLTFTEATNVYVRFYLKRTWKLQAGSATFAQRTFTVDSDLAFVGVKGKTELSPNGLQVLNSESVYFKIDRKNFVSGNPYVDIGGDVQIDGNLTVTGNINIEGDVENSDVSVANLRERLGEINSDFTIGSSSSVDATFAGDVTVSGSLHGPATFYIDPSPDDTGQPGGATTDTGTVVILGDLQVTGQTTTVDSTVISIADLNMTLASNASNASEANGAGLTIGGASATMTYNSTSDRFVFNKNIQTNLIGNVTGNLTGNVTGNVTGDVTGNVTGSASLNVLKTGDTMTGDLDFDDNVSIKLGTGDDMTIYHSGSHSFIRQIGTGSLYIDQASDDKNIIFRNDNGSGGLDNYIIINGSNENVEFFKPISGTSANFSGLVTLEANLRFNDDTEGIIFGTSPTNNGSIFFDATLDGVIMQQTQGTDWSRIRVGDINTNKFEVFGGNSTDSGEFNGTGWTSLFSINADGNTNIASGNLQIGGVEIVDSSRRATFIQADITTGDISFANGQGIVSASGASVKTGTGGNTFQVQGGGATSDAFIVSNSSGTTQLSVDAGGDGYSYFAGKLIIGGTAEPTDNFRVNGSALITGTLTLNATDGDELAFEGGKHWITSNDGAGNFNIRVGHYDNSSGIEECTESGYIFHDEWSQQAGWREFNVSADSMAVGELIGTDSSWRTQIEYDTNSVYLRYQGNTRLTTASNGVYVDGGGVRVNGTTNNLWITEVTDGEWHIYDTFQDNGIKIYSSTGGMEFQYNGVTEMTIDGNGVVFNGTVDLSDADLNIGSADIIFGIDATDTGARGLYWNFDGDGDGTASLYAYVRSGGTLVGEKMQFNTNGEETITGSGAIYEFKNSGSDVVTIGADGSVTADSFSGDGSGLTKVFNAKAELGSAEDLDNFRTTGYMSQNSNLQAAAGTNYPTSFAGILEVINDDTGNGVHTVQRYSRYASNDVYTRYYYNGGWQSWARFLTTSDEGSGNGLDADTVDGLQASQFLRSDADDTATGMITINSTGGGILRLQNNDTSNAQNQTLGSIVWNNQDASSTGPNNAAIIEAQTYGTLGQGANLLFKTVLATTEGEDATTGMTLFGNGNLTVVGDVTAPTFIGSLTGNASTATKWANARTITLGGDLTGNVSIDGSSNVTLSAQVVNDSHTHDGRYYTEGETDNIVAQSLGWVPAYNNANINTVQWNDTEQAVRLYSSSDSTIGMAYKAIRVKAGDKVRFTVMAKSSFASTSGFYVRLYQHNGDLPDGKTHVSNDAAYTYVQEDDSGDTGWYDNEPIGTSWVNIERLYTAPADGYVSLVILNWTGLGTGAIYVKQPDIQFEKVNQATSADDATTLDGNASSYFINTSNIGSQSVNYATGCDVVDGLHASSFLRTDTDSSTTGYLRVNGVSVNTTGVVLGTYTGGTSLSASEVVLGSGGKTGWGVGDEFGAIRWYNTDGSGVGARDAAKIVAWNATGNGTNTTTFSGQLSFYTSEYNNLIQENLRLTYTGNMVLPNGSFGIGISAGTTPSDNLIVGGDAYITGGTDYTLKLGRPSGKPSIKAETDDGGYLLMDSNGGIAGLNWYSSDDVVLALGGGDVGIGTDSPSQLLHLASTGSAKILLEADTDNVTETDNAGIIFSQDGGAVVGRVGYQYNTNDLELMNEFDGNVFIGQNNSPNITIDNTGNVGIGTTSPSEKLQIADGGINITGGTNNRNIYIDHSNFDFRATTTSGWAFGLRSATNDGSTIMSYVGGAFGNGPLSTDFQYNFYGGTGYNDAAIYIPASKNVGIGNTSPSYPLDVTGRARITDDLFLGHIIYHNGDTNTYMEMLGDRIRFYCGGVRMLDMIESTTDKIIIPVDVSIANAADPAYALDVGGTIRASGDVIAYSDARVKENVHTIDNALDKVTQLRGVSYNKIGETEEKIGVIAQEIEKVLPQVVQEDAEGMKSVAYGNIVGVLIEAIKEQQKQIDELKSRLDA